MMDKSREKFYVGVCNNIEVRVSQHKHGESNYTSRYDCCYLMYYEHHLDIEVAIKREKLMKRWKRDFKFRLIKWHNPDMKDLADNWT